MRAAAAQAGDAAGLQRSRALYRVRAEDAALRTSPDAIPETPGESGGLLDLVPPVAKRAIELGLCAREPSFHVFVAAEPEVKVEGDIASAVVNSMPVENGDSLLPMQMNQGSRGAHEDKECNGGGG